MSSKFLLITGHGEIDMESNIVDDFKPEAALLLEDNQKAIVYKRVGEYVSSGVKFVKEKD